MDFENRGAAVKKNLTTLMDVASPVTPSSLAEDPLYTTNLAQVENDESQDEDSADDPNSPSQAALAKIQQAKTMIQEVLTPATPANKKARKSGEDEDPQETGRKLRKNKAGNKK